MNEMERFNENLQKANNGDVEAMIDVAHDYSYGNGCDMDQEKAATWLERAAKAGHTDAMLALAIYLMIGKGVEKDVDQSTKWLQKAADAGDPTAMNNLGVAYKYGRGVDQDYEKAMYWFKEAAKMSEGVFGQVNIGEMYKIGVGVPQSDEKAVECFKKGAEAGSDINMVALGLCYILGTGVPQDDDKAYALFQKAYELNCLQGQYALGKCYLLGLGVKKDEAKAFDLFNEMKGYGFQSDFELAECYRLGRGCEQDDEKAKEYYLSSAKFNIEEAALKIVELLHKDELFHDEEEVISFFKEHGGKKACQSALGKYYYDKGDFKEAIKWYEKATKDYVDAPYSLQVPHAMTQYALMLKSGQGCEMSEENDHKAHELLKKASYYDYALAKEILSQLVD